MISLRDIITEKSSVLPEEKVKERSWVLVFCYNPSLKILLARDDENNWSFPGGQLDDGETAEEAAWRELKEETGIVPEKLEFLKTIYHDKPNKLKVSNVFYTEISKNVKLKASSDVEKLKWFSINDLPKLDDLSKPKKGVVDLAVEKVYDSKKELAENISDAIALGIPLQLLTERKQHKKTEKGYLIVFEGIDGAGKSTQRKLLTKWLEGKGWKVSVSKWGTSPEISELIKNGKEQRWLTPALFSLLNASDMVWRYENEIKPALDKGHVVICDRYYYTSYVRDSLRGVNKKMLDHIYENFVEPDLVVHFKVPPRLAVERLLREKGFKWYSGGMDIGYHKNLEECALIYETNMDREYDEVLKKAKNYKQVVSERRIGEIFHEIKHFIYERVKAVRRKPSMEEGNIKLANLI